MINQVSAVGPKPYSQMKELNMILFNTKCNTAKLLGKRGILPLPLGVFHVGVNVVDVL